MKEKGWIALDIDGTTTAHVTDIPFEVIEELKTLSEARWRIFFITGRLYSWALETVERLPFPFFFGVQNGADIFEMPAKRLASRAYLTPDIISFLDREYRTIQGDFLIYSGFEKGDFCYFRPHHFLEETRDYLELLKGFSPSPWQEREEFTFDLKETFPLIKCFGSKEEMTPLYEKLKKSPDIAVSMIRDPLSPNYYLLLITDRGATKGTALERIRTESHASGPIIAAGDDFNDLPMLELADVKIVMETAPQEMHPLADIIASPASENGLIPALKQAIMRL